jgi:hypothetical protein
MKTRCQSRSTSAERAAPYGPPTADELPDDPLTRIHRYQQHLRAELLGADADRAVPPSRCQRLWDSPLAPLFTVATVQAIKGWFTVLADARLKRYPPAVGAAGAS